MRSVLSILAILTPWVMGREMDAIRPAEEYDVEAVMHVAGEQELIVSECSGLYLIVHIASGERGEKSIIGPEMVHEVVALAKDIGCAGVRVRGEAVDQTVEQDLKKEADEAQISIVNESKEGVHVDLCAEGDLPTAQQVIHKLQEAASQGKEALVLDLPVNARGAADEKCMQLLRRVGHWARVNMESVEDVSPVNLELPEDWKATVSRDENTYLLCPVMHPNKEVILKIPAHLIDTVVPEVLGQPDQKVQVCRIEEPGKDEPRAFMQFTIPVVVWDQAVEGMPVIKLMNAR